MLHCLFLRRHRMRRFMMTLGGTVVVLGSALVAGGQDKAPQAPMQAPIKQAPMQAPAPAPVKQAPLQAPLQAPAKQAPMQAPVQKPMQAPTQAPMKGGYPAAPAASTPAAPSYQMVSMGRRWLFGRR